MMKTRQWIQTRSGKLPSFMHLISVNIGEIWQQIGVTEKKCKQRNWFLNLCSPIKQ